MQRTVLERAGWMLGVALALVSGCDEPKTACTLEMRSSLGVAVQDASGVVARDAAVRFSIDGGAWREAECMDVGADGEECGRWIAGWEEAGVFDVDAESADGLLHAQAVVEVEEGDCHVESEAVTLTLD